MNLYYKIDCDFEMYSINNILQPNSTNMPSKQSQSHHTMTLRSSHTKTDVTCEKVQVHPKSWDKHTHYGQCGQSCPCCRSEVGDTWGSCPICKSK